MWRIGFMDERMMPHETAAITTLPHPWLMLRYKHVFSTPIPEEMKCKSQFFEKHCYIYSPALDLTQ